MGISTSIGRRFGGLIDSDPDSDPINLFQIDKLEQRLREKTRLRAEYQLLKTAPGIGEVLATTIMLETGTVSRFAAVGNFSSYCRCVGSVHTSNNKKKGEGNRKNGNKYLACGIELFTSRALIVELEDVLSRGKFAKQLSQTRFSSAYLLARYTQLATLITPTAVSGPELRDPGDEAVIACALAARADLIVSGDHDLRVLKTYGAIRIVSAAEALRIIASP